MWSLHYRKKSQFQTPVKQKASYLVGVPAMSLLGQRGAFGKAFQKLLGQVDFQMSMFICEWHKTITEYEEWAGILKPKLCCSPEFKTLGAVLFKQRSNHFFVNYWVVWIQCHYCSRDSFKETSMSRCSVCKLLWQPFQKYKTINQARDLKGGALRKQWKKTKNLRYYCEMKGNIFGAQGVQKAFIQKCRDFVFIEFFFI